MIANSTLFAGSLAHAPKTMRASAPVDCDYSAVARLMIWASVCSLSLAAIYGLYAGVQAASGSFAMAAGLTLVLQIGLHLVGRLLARRAQDDGAAWAQ